jgi:hypothetical protein
VSSAGAGQIVRRDEGKRDPLVGILNQLVDSRAGEADIQPHG